MANSFAMDKAVGGGGPAQSTAPTPGSFGSPSSATSTMAADPRIAQVQAGAAGLAGMPAPVDRGNDPNLMPTNGSESGLAGLGVPADSGSGSPGSFPSFQTGNAPGGGQGSNVPQASGGIFFDAGGSVPDDNGDSQQQDPMSAILQRSLGSVDQVLQQMYKQYGLGGQDQQGGIQEAADDQYPFTGKTKQWNGGRRRPHQ